MRLVLQNFFRQMVAAGLAASLITSAAPAVANFKPPSQCSLSIGENSSFAEQAIVTAILNVEFPLSLHARLNELRWVREKVSASPDYGGKEWAGLLLAMSHSAGPVEWKMESRGNRSVYWVRTSRGIFRFTGTRDRRQELFDDEAGNRWRWDFGSQVTLQTNRRRAPRPERITVADTFFNAWTHEALPEQIQTTLKYLKPNGYSKAMFDRLAQLQADVQTGQLIPACSTKPRDSAYWRDHVAARFHGQRWNRGTLSELELHSYAARLVLDILNYWTFPIDPFETVKTTALETEVSKLPAQLRALQQQTPEQRLSDLLWSATWGNKFDPTNPIAEGKTLIKDDRKEVTAALKSLTNRTIDYEADNAGPELLNDLLLIDHLLRHEQIAQITLRVKNYPYLVSDATEEDVAHTIEVLRQHPDPLVQETGERLYQWVNTQRLTITTHPFTTTGLSFFETPANLQAEIEKAGLRIVKGDANYRRLVDNRYWGIQNSISDIIPAWMPPTLILRAAKNEIIVGADPKAVAALESHDARWYRKGVAGIIQLTQPPRLSEIPRRFIFSAAAIGMAFFIGGGFLYKNWVMTWGHTSQLFEFLSLEPISLASKLFASVLAQLFQHPGDLSTFRLDWNRMRRQMKVAITLNVLVEGMYYEWLLPVWLISDTGWLGHHANLLSFTRALFDQIPSLLYLDPGNHHLTNRAVDGASEKESLEDVAKHTLSFYKVSAPLWFATVFFANFFPRPILNYMIISIGTMVWDFLLYVAKDIERVKRRIYAQVRHSRMIHMIRTWMPHREKKFLLGRLLFFIFSNVQWLYSRPWFGIYLEGITVSILAFDAGAILRPYASNQVLASVVTLMAATWIFLRTFPHLARPLVRLGKAAAIGISASFLLLQPLQGKLTAYSPAAVVLVEST